ncbi:MarR family winged helix-turn-helix transcriptional regulator [Streptomyces pratensis]|uniref:MarR family winged helix-turn-helix transcriptional regulator n=1 Tax=Streptomyces pratensis TaxID=1169025 RepID=UPI001EE4A2D8|nr:MarR family winged helix-turn-helix transcriptional regulator [Streptomyces pratensis]
MNSTSDHLSPSEDRVWRAYFETQVLFWKRLAQQLQQDTGLSEPDFAILSALVEAPDARLRAFELSGVTQFEKSRLHHHLNRMIGRGLLTREQCPGASRGTVIVLSPDGRSAIEAALPLRAGHIRRWLTAPLDDGQIRALAEISETMLGHLRTNESTPDAASDCG